MFNLAFLVYAVIQIQEIKDAFDTLEDNALDATSLVLVSVIPGIIAAAEVVFCTLSWYIYKLIGWQIYKRLGADRAMKRMFVNYQGQWAGKPMSGEESDWPNFGNTSVSRRLCPPPVFICILKFDFFFFSAFSLQFVLLVLDQSDLEVRGRRPRNRARTSQPS